jgi:dTDP-4-amino-4,6-dideoxygalactose transaminase
VTTWAIPLFDTQFGPDETAAVLRPLKAGWLTMGEEVLALEAELEAVTGARHAIAVTNATTALQLACAAVGVGPGDEVICPTLTFAATANAPRAFGARIRLCDSISEDDLTIDPASIAANITPSTRAIIVVHFAGFACRMDEILALADEHGIPVIEDAAHAVFTRHRGKMLGLHGTIGCFSFYSNKNITCGEGGAIVTDDDALAERVRLLRSHGMTAPTLDRHRGVATSYDVVLAGFNGRLDELRAALLRAQLTRLPEYLDRRRELFARYVEGFRDTPIAVPFSTGRFIDELAETGVHLMPVLLPDRRQRPEVMARLKEARIQTSIHYPPIHRFRTYREPGRDLERTSDLADRELTLPFFPGMADEQVDRVVAALLQAVGETELREPPARVAAVSAGRR